MDPERDEPADAGAPGGGTITPPFNAND